MSDEIRSLDIVWIKEYGVPAIITQVSDSGDVSLEVIGKHPGCKVAWYDKEELVVMDSLPHLLARIATSPGNSGFKIPETYFKGSVEVEEDE